MEQQQSANEKSVESARYAREIVNEELEREKQDLVRISICLGILEAALTAKSQQTWPTDIEVIML